METHIEDDREMLVWYEKMTQKYVTMADFWRRICKYLAESTYYNIHTQEWHNLKNPFLIHVKKKCKYKFQYYNGSLKCPLAK